MEVVLLPEERTNLVSTNWQGHSYAISKPSSEMTARMAVIGYLPA